MDAVIDKAFAKVDDQPKSSQQDGHPFWTIMNIFRSLLFEQDQVVP